MFKALKEMKLNALGVIAVALMCSTFTLVGSHYIQSRVLASTAVSSSELIASETASVLDCAEGVYSPVQRQCVSQDIFDAEMKRLFSALGIDIAIYEQSNIK